VLRAFYDRYRDDLPEARSADPGFRQPHRARYDFLVAKAGVFREEEEKKITDEQIKAFYDDRKAALYKTKPEEKATPEKPVEDSSDSKSDSTPESGREPEKKEGAATPRLPVRQVAFKQPAGAAAETAATKDVTNGPKVAETDAAKKDGEKAGEKEAAAGAEGAAPTASDLTTGMIGLTTKDWYTLTYYSRTLDETSAVRVGELLLFLVGELRHLRTTGSRHS
jgi:hypothetical protein